MSARIHERLGRIQALQDEFDNEHLMARAKRTAAAHDCRPQVFDNEDVHGG